MRQAESEKIMEKAESIKKARGYFGEFGGRYVPETLVRALDELDENYLNFKNDKDFKAELKYYLHAYA